MKVHFDIQDNAVKGLDIRVDPAEGLILHSALLQYTNELKNNEVNRAIALNMCDAYLEAIERSKRELVE